MDNQFTSTSGDSTHQQPVTPPGQQTVQEPASVPPARQKRSIKKIIQILLLIALLGATAGGIYYWQHQELQDVRKINTALNNQLNTSNKQLEQQKLTGKELVDVADKALANTSTASTTTSLIPGEVTNKTTTAARLAALFDGDAKLTALWIEYGTDSTSLAKATPHLTKELGMGSMGIYAEAVFDITQLETGKQYFYRVAATLDGKTIYSGIAGFTVSK